MHHSIKQQIYVGKYHADGQVLAKRTVGPVELAQLTLQERGQLGGLGFVQAVKLERAHDALDRLGVDVPFGGGDEAARLQAVTALEDPVAATGFEFNGAGGRSTIRSALCVYADCESQAGTGISGTNHVKVPVDAGV
jgi:hypothetical protein